jgi:hypothetical protein
VCSHKHQLMNQLLQFYFLIVVTVAEENIYLYGSEYSDGYVVL